VTTMISNDYGSHIRWLIVRIRVVVQLENVTPACSRSQKLEQSMLNAQIVSIGVLNQIICWWSKRCHANSLTQRGSGRRGTTRPYVRQPTSIGSAYEPPSDEDELIDRIAASRKIPYPPNQYQPIGLKRISESTTGPRTTFGYAPLPSVIE